MGYTTEFTGSFALDKPLTPEHKAFLEMFNETRRVKRNPALLSKDPIREKAGLTSAGVDGEYFVAGKGVCGQDHDKSIVEYDGPPGEQPSLWCQWRPNEVGMAIEWDEGEKFYEYVPWLEYLIKHFLAPWGYKLNGTVTWQGERRDDSGSITVEDNFVSVEMDEPSVFTEESILY